MANLREQLLRAGLVDRSTKQAVDTQVRRANKKKKSRRKGKKTRARAGDPVDTETEARLRYERQMAETAEANRAREAARRAAREDRERADRLRNLVQAWAIRQRQPGRQRFCFVTREDRIRWIYVTAELAWRLERGSLAIVEQPGVEQEPFAIVPDTTARRIQQIAPEAIRFWTSA